MTRQATHADIGRIVRYYLNGHRFGHLLKIEAEPRRDPNNPKRWAQQPAQIAVIQPPIKGKHCVRVPLEDVEVAEEPTGGLPPPTAVAVSDGKGQFVLIMSKGTA